MNRMLCWLGGMLWLCAIVVAQEPSGGKKPATAPSLELKTTRDQASYAIGRNVARSIKNDGLEVNLEALVQGLRDALTNTQSKLTDAQLRAALEQFGQEMDAKMQEKVKVVGDKNKREGEAFLAANKGKPGVVTLPSGLQYVILKSGKGASPKLTDEVTAHYHGTLIDGTVFDSSVQRNEPFRTPVGGVIRGWVEALQKMKVGDKWKLFVPSDLAYGPQGGGPIGPNAVLIFEMELLSIEPRQ